MKKPLKILTTTLLLTPLVLACFTFSQMAHAEPDVNPPPDGGYPGFTTAEGHQALQRLTSGIGNSAFGWRSLFSVTTASYNTGLGGGTLALNIARPKYFHRRGVTHPEHDRHTKHRQWSGRNGME